MMERRRTLERKATGFIAIAQLRGVAHGTVRALLARVHAKSGASFQAGLIDPAGD